MLGQPLLKTEEATEFFSQPETLRKVLLGDPERVSGPEFGGAYNSVVAAHNALGDGMTKIAALTQDKTRTEVQRHAAAQTVAERTVAQLAATEAHLKATAKHLQKEAEASVDEQFNVDPNRASLQSEIRGWIREQATKPEGLATIRNALKADREVAAVIYHSPHFLLGLAPDVRDNMRIDGIERHLPKAYKMIEGSIALNEAAAKYPAAIAKVRRTFFSKGLADQAASRVEV